jgi:hypothetical protein
MGLKDIGAEFGIGESDVAPAGRRVTADIENNRKLKKKIAKTTSALRF